ncbi:MAG: single-stranded-DNA-specific exonuclease RecJ [Flavobacteriales bacterium]|nr:single-stranded-DNA-specific exonuclease RecJ [Flavobacteriales bacterium]
MRWEVKEKSSEEAIKKLSEELNNLTPSLTNILIQRGINSLKEAKHFFRPDLTHTHNPFLMQDMEKAIERIEKAIANNEKILVFGDYDVDGTTSVALVYSYLSNFYSNLGYYIPDRYAEGYGISLQGIDYAEQNNFSLIIALDCGIKAIDKVAYANQKNIDFIICDHHQPSDTIPNAVAVLDPKRRDCDYPYKELSGCGVGFKLMQAWSIKTGKDEQLLNNYLDLLAISICADIVPITGENRVFVYYGLKVINENPRLGVKTLIDLTGKKKDLTSTDVVFTIAPRINAAGRIETGNKAVEMLVEENKTSALGFGKNINELNTDRKDLDRDITAEALAMIEENTLLQTKKTTVLYQENWHKGVIGIVASRLIETHYRPTIILTESNGKATGSARSVKDFDIYNAIDACSDLLEQFGGHKYAAGLTMKLENLDAFIEKFEEVVNDQIDDDLLIPQVNIDAKLELNQINDKFYSILKQFAPTGPSNMRPVFMSENVFSTSNSRIVGDNHLKLEVFQEENPDLRFACIAFNMGYLLDEIAEGVPFSIVYNIEENTWNGNTTLQLSIKDLKV